MGHDSGKTVKLHRHDMQENTEMIIAAAPMTRANRELVYENYPVSAVILQNKHE